MEFTFKVRLHAVVFVDNVVALSWEVRTWFFN